MTWRDKRSTTVEILSTSKGKVGVSRAIQSTTVEILSTSKGVAGKRAGLQDLQQ